MSVTGLGLNCTTDSHRGNSDTWSTGQRDTLQNVVMFKLPLRRALVQLLLQSVLKALLLESSCGILQCWREVGCKQEEMRLSLALYLARMKFVA